MVKSLLFSGVIAAAAGIALQGGEPPRRIQILPMGEFSPRGHGAMFRIDDIAQAQAIIDTSKAHLGATDMLVDRDHQSIFGAKPDVGGQAPAAGWIKPDSLTAQADGIWAEVEWTPAAAAQLKAKEYRYLSPVFTADKSGRVTRIINVAITNSPAIEELAAAAAEKHEGSDMLKDIAKALGLGEDADVAACTAAIAALNQAGQTLNAARQALGVKDGEDLVAAATAAKAGAVDPARYAPVAMVVELQGQLKALQDGTASDKAEAAVAAAMEAGKVTPAQKDWALSYARSDASGFESYIAAAAVIVAPGARKLPGAQAPDQKITSLDGAAKSVAAMLGVPGDKYLANLNTNLQGGVL